MSRASARDLSNALPALRDFQTGVGSKMITYEMPERLDVSTATEVEKALVKLAETEQPDRMVCDFSKTVYVSSAGLRVLLMMTKKIKAAGGEFILCALPEQVLEVFKLAGFTSIMDIRDKVE